MKPLAENQPLFQLGFQPEAILAAGDLLGVGVLVTDLELRLTGWNQWLAGVSGFSADEVLGRPLLELFPTLAGSSSETAFRRALVGETVVLSHRFHEYLIPLQGDPSFPEFPVMQQSARITPLFRSGTPVGAIALIDDVTERVARELELRRAVEQAQGASKAKSEFIAAMSHELRTPLSAIIGYADILITEIAGPLASGQKDHLQRVKSGAWHLLGIIEEILSFSRADAGREQVHREEISMTVVTDDAIALVGPQAARKGLTLKLNIEDVPATLETDGGKLRQILVNLLANAVKFTDQGEVELRVFPTDERVCFAIRDTGPGVPPEEIERIFEPFTQVDYSLTRVKGGTGLGLAVSRRLSTLLGGELTVESTTGVGSVFTLHLPRG